MILYPLYNVRGWLVNQLSKLPFHTEALEYACCGLRICSFLEILGVSMLVIRWHVWVPYLFAYFLDHIDVISYLPVVNNTVFFARFYN